MDPGSKSIHSLIAVSGDAVLEKYRYSEGILELQLELSEVGGKARLRIRTDILAFNSFYLSRDEAYRTCRIELLPLIDHLPVENGIFRPSADFGKFMQETRGRMHLAYGRKASEEKYLFSLAGSGSLLACVVTDLDAIQFSVRQPATAGLVSHQPPDPMRDISSILSKAIHSHTDWMVGSFYTAIERLTAGGVSVSFWEGVENWATMHMDEVLVGYVWRKYPLVAVQRASSVEVRRLMDGLEMVQYLELDSLSEDRLWLDSAAFSAYLDGFTRWDGFTAEDLWFETNV